MLTLKTTAVIACSVFAMVGCSSADIASVNKKEVLTLINKPVCCTSYSQFSWIPLQGADISVNINEHSQVGLFPDGKSYFAAFSLPEHVEQMRITLDSLIRNERVFASNIMFLNDKFEPVKNINLSEFELISPNLLQRAAYQHIFTMTAKMAPYMVVYSSQQYQGKSIIIPHPERLRAQELGLPRPIVIDPEISYAETGQLHLTLKPINLKSYQAKIPASLVPVSTTKTSDNMLSETEDFYNQQIKKAIEQNNIKKALQLLNEAKRAGSMTAESVFIKLVK
ncbi:hypothetical protein UA38_16840 [Photobacterium kishitanii]|uniref:Transcriptional regulator n=1 Tax=Photobacterium kishitanii TaxID=318456 RepID=A0AAX0YYR4_9GAMM|nr:MalM family protein [Photobacterium kishitanii]KJG56025.1 hypothetical protein UA38_16840 [Photobacterium kishitanii]KJG62879.1 hypothetical protein UA42_00245 [Photobacterium kishitanii]KJG64222.1 hypothetical protein UA40_17975 [Photobacterium kishitanii]KJG68786.1 hypothetical protein UA41_15260 [Photobacterium kishitanii]PSX20054.1 transcriptional regulator [Photobacterium kishitanii]